MYNVADDWSDSSNPNGVWSYHVDGALAQSGTRIGDTFSNPPGAPKIWANWHSTYVGWSKSNGSEQGPNPTWDLKPGDVYGHTTSFNIIEIRWTSPWAGTIHVSGGVWALRDINRWNNWQLDLNGVVKASGTVGDGDPYSSSNPAAIDLTLDVVVGDILAFSAVKNSAGSYGDYIALDLGVDPISVVPVPGAALLGILGLSYSGWRLRRQRTL